MKAMPAVCSLTIVCGVAFADAAVDSPPLIEAGIAVQEAVPLTEPVRPKEDLLGVVLEHLVEDDPLEVSTDEPILILADDVVIAEDDPVDAIALVDEPNQSPEALLVQQLSLEPLDSVGAALAAEADPIAEAVEVTLEEIVEGAMESPPAAAEKLAADSIAPPAEEEPVVAAVESLPPATSEGVEAAGAVPEDERAESGAEGLPEPQEEELVVAEELAGEVASQERSEEVFADVSTDLLAGTSPAAEPSAKSVELGITDDMTAGAEIRGGLISLSLKDVELQDVVRLFSRLSNANIIVPSMLDEDEPKRVDVNLDNVEWKPALQAILDTHGLELIEKIPGSDVYSIRERPADAPDPMEIKVFKLKYATVDEVVKMVDVLVEKDGGQISTYPARNSIVAQGTAKLINNLERIVMAVDMPREQVFIEAKFLELSDSASEQLGIDWNVLGGYKVGVGGISGRYNSETSRASRDNRYSDIAGRPYELLEKEPDDPQWIEDPNNPGSYKLYNGIERAARSGNNPRLLRMFGIKPTHEALHSAAVGKTLGATLSASDFNLVMSALREMNGANVVSNPKIIVANEQTATIHIGQKKPNIKGTIQTAGDSQVNRVYALDDVEPYFEDGVRVDVTPTINTEENITVRIQPTLDRLDADPTVAPDGTQFWGKSTKTIDTVFGLEDGQTAAIGGLTEATKSDVSRKVPLLGDLPYIGRLFSFKSKNAEQVETIIFVTVGLANPASIEFETGLPEDSSLAMRHRATASTERSIQQEELKLLKAQESRRLEKRIQALHAAEPAP